MCLSYLLFKIEGCIYWRIVWPMWIYSILYFVRRSVFTALYYRYLFIGKFSSYYLFKDSIWHWVSTLQINMFGCLSVLLCLIGIVSVEICLILFFILRIGVFPAYACSVLLFLYVYYLCYLWMLPSLFLSLSNYFTNKICLLVGCSKDDNVNYIHKTRNQTFYQ